ncbi:hypothetical protein DFA_11429 [Cavenderia fasciculata]|uniref:Uncharacterized protein n=1 Tax=Cavenderia fasciculata TaxID=261658 RepID=F4QCY7_CACFS|nr:uncharacterized protein DFA_11429 [Cavenderia fasciculata]EGG13668.1 hypothetical protein DFA_11429 [Cavenderia fasciculata]|eukprot:XP_004350372.1 hypothetical protein DFA_11429 [Cavenderia fasciculata]
MIRDHVVTQDNNDSSSYEDKVTALKNNGDNIQQQQGSIIVASLTPTPTATMQINSSSAITNGVESLNNHSTTITTDNNQNNNHKMDVDSSTIEPTKTSTSTTTTSTTSTTTVNRKKDQPKKSKVKKETTTATTPSKSKSKSNSSVLPLVINHTGKGETSTSTTTTTTKPSVVSPLISASVSYSDTESETDDDQDEPKELNGLDHWRRDYNELKWRSNWLNLQIKDLQYNNYLCEQSFTKLRKTKPKIDIVKTNHRNDNNSIQEEDDEDLNESSTSIRTTPLKIISKKPRKLLKKQVPTITKKQIKKEFNQHPLNTTKCKFYQADQLHPGESIQKEKKIITRPKKFDITKDKRFQFYDKDDQEINIEDIFEPPATPPPPSPSPAALEHHDIIDNGQKINGTENNLLLHDSTSTQHVDEKDKEKEKEKPTPKQKRVSSRNKTATTTTTTTSSPIILQLEGIDQFKTAPVTPPNETLLSTTTIVSTEQDSLSLGSTVVTTMDSEQNGFDAATAAAALQEIDMTSSTTPPVNTPKTRKKRTRKFSATPKKEKKKPVVSATTASTASTTTTAAATMELSAPNTPTLSTAAPSTPKRTRTKKLPKVVVADMDIIKPDPQAEGSVDKLLDTTTSSQNQQEQSLALVVLEEKQNSELTLENGGGQDSYLSEDEYSSYSCSCSDYSGDSGSDYSSGDDDSDFTFSDSESHHHHHHMEIGSDGGKGGKTLKKSRRNTRLSQKKGDINDIYIPLVGSNFSIPVLQYREIVTPEWREVTAGDIKQQSDMTMPSPLLLAGSKSNGTTIVSGGATSSTTTSLTTTTTTMTTNSLDHIGLHQAPIPPNPLSLANNKTSSLPPTPLLEKTSLLLTPSSTPTLGESQLDEAHFIHIDEGIVINESFTTTTYKSMDPVSKFSQIIDDPIIKMNLDGNDGGVDANSKEMGESSGDEDTDDESYARFHAVHEIEEKKRYFTYIEEGKKRKDKREFNLSVEELLPSYKFNKKEIKLLGPTWNGSTEIIIKKHRHRHHHHHHRHRSGDNHPHHQEKKRRYIPPKNSIDAMLLDENGADVEDNVVSRRKKRQPPLPLHKSMGGIRSQRKTPSKRLLSKSSGSLPTKRGKKRYLDQDDEFEDGSSGGINNNNTNRWWIDNTFVWEHVNLNNHSTTTIDNFDNIINHQNNNNNNNNFINHDNNNNNNENTTTRTPLILKLKRTKSEEYVKKPDPVELNHEKEIDNNNGIKEEKENNGQNNIDNIEEKKLQEETNINNQIEQKKSDEMITFENNLHNQCAGNDSLAGSGNGFLNTENNIGTGTT